MNDDHLFKMAREVSFDADYQGCGSAKLGAVIAYKGTVLARGYNCNKTHTMQDKWNIKRYKNVGNHYLPAKAHAEICALSKIQYLDIDFSKVHIYIYRETKDGHIAMAKPCPSCREAIKSMGIKHIYYTTNEGYCHEYLKGD